MAKHPLGPALDRVRAVLSADGTAGVPDAALLGRYLDGEDTAALEALVVRHAPMVLAVCRRVAACPQDADDAFQATFLVLVRKANNIRPRGNVGCWLHGVATRAALKARAGTSRRHTRERPMNAEPVDPREPPEPDDLLPVLDRELAALPAVYRTAIVVCDLEGRTRAEAAAQLGWPEGTVGGRLARARALLARRMARFAPRAAGGALAAALTQGAAVAVPPALLDTALQVVHPRTDPAALALAFPRGVALADRLVKAMLLADVRRVVGVALALAVALVGGAALFANAHSPTADEPSVSSSRSAPAPSPEGAWWFEGNGFGGELTVEVAADGQVAGTIHHDRIRGRFDPATGGLTFTRVASVGGKDVGVQTYSGRLTGTPAGGRELSGSFRPAVGVDANWGEAGQEYTWAAAPLRQRLPDLSVKEIMLAAHRRSASDPGPPALSDRVVGGQASTDEQRRLLDLYRELARRPPPRGDAEQWADRTRALIDATEAVVAGRDGAPARLAAARDCAACHNLHMRPYGLNAPLRIGPERKGTSEPPPKPEPPAPDRP